MGSRFVTEDFAVETISALLHVTGTDCFSQTCRQEVPT